MQMWQLMLVRLICAISRLQLAPLMLNIAKETDYTAVQRGSVLGAFTAGYTVTQLLGGSLERAMGVKTTVSVMLFVNAVLVLLTPIAASHSFTVFWGVYFCTGLVQGPIFVLCNIMCSRWILPNERSRASAMIDNGGTFGNFAVTCLVPWLSFHFGWVHVLQMTGACSMLLLCLWGTAAANSPTDCWYIESSEVVTLKPLQTFVQPLRQSASWSQQLQQLVQPLQHLSVWALFWLHAVPQDLETYTHLRMQARTKNVRASKT